MECDAKGYHQTLNFIDEKTEALSNSIIYQRSQLKLSHSVGNSTYSLEPRTYRFSLFIGKVSLLSKFEYTNVVSCQEIQSGPSPAALSSVIKTRAQGAGGQAVTIFQVQVLRCTSRF